MAELTRGHTYAANTTVSAANLGSLIMSATITLISRDSVDKTNYTLATRGSSQPPGPYDGELWQDSTNAHPVLKSYRSPAPPDFQWVMSLPYATVLLNDAASQTWSQGTLIAAGATDGTYRIANAGYEPFSVTDHGESNVLAVALETVAAGATGYAAFHGALPVIDDGTGSGVTAGVPVMLSDSVPGAAARRSGSGDADRLIGYALTQPGDGELPANMFWCRFFR